MRIRFQHQRHQPGAVARLRVLPMLEVMTLFRASRYKTHLVPGGGQDFVRVYSEQVYGIPPAQAARPARCRGA